MSTTKKVLLGAAWTDVSEGASSLYVQMIDAGGSVELFYGATASAPDDTDEGLRMSGGKWEGNFTIDAIDALDTVWMRSKERPNMPVMVIQKD